MNLLTIIELDLDCLDTDVIGIADSVEAAEKMIDKYYGDHKVVKVINIDEYGYEYKKRIEVLDHNGDPYEAMLTLQWMKLNEV